MIGRMTLFIITILILMTMLINFMTVVNNNIIESHIYEYISSYTEKISMEGVISSADCFAIQDHLMSIGDLEVIYKYSRRIGPGLYEVTVDQKDITDRAFDKGDIINIIVSRHNNVIINKVSYVMVNKQEYTMGYDVIKSIKNKTVPVSVRNKGQADYIVYDEYLNPYYGDDAAEMPYNSGYISECSRYVKREGYDGDTLTEISYTEY
jgi:hypothetical protein